MVKKATSVIILLAVLLTGVAAASTTAKADRNLPNIDYDAYSVEELRAMQSLILAAIQKKESQGQQSGLNQSSGARTADDSVIEISPQALIDAYKANEHAADEKYKGKNLEVKGIVSSIRQGVRGDFYITLVEKEEPFNFSSIMAYIKESEYSNLRKIKKGDTVAVRGICTGAAVSGAILEECVFP